MRQDLDDQISIWLDVDTGHNDAYALLLAAHHPRASNTCAVLEALGRSDVPVIRGAAKPLHRNAVHAPQYHGTTGLDGVSLLPIVTKYDPKELPAGVGAIYHRLMEEPHNSITIITTGPLTNIAQLLLSFPDVVSVVRGVSIMGGAIGSGFTTAPSHRSDGPGNWTQWAEFNIYCDPEAAEVVLTHPKLCTNTCMATLDLTHLCRANEGVFAHLFPNEGSASRVRRMMEEVMVYFRESYSENADGALNGPPLHDAVAVFLVLERASILDVGAKLGYTVQVETKGEQTGRTLLGEAIEHRGVMMPRAIDLQRFWCIITECLERATEASPI